MKYNVPEIKIVEFNRENIVTESVVQVDFTKTADIDLGEQNYNYGNPAEQSPTSVMAFN